MNDFKAKKDFSMTAKNDRIKELLGAAYYLLKKQEESPYTLDLLEEIVVYDGAEVDGQCLLEDIANALGITDDAE